MLAGLLSLGLLFAVFKREDIKAQVRAREESEVRFQGLLSVRVGMTPTEVESKAGSPSQRQTRDTENHHTEYWYYENPGVRTQIAFEDGKVEAISTN
jgi:outer membrane protein assembly factor BamE (lipoprotein component of BamABCDE complex)